MKKISWVSQVVIKDARLFEVLITGIRMAFRYQIERLKVFLSSMKPWAFDTAPRPGTSHLFAQINNLRLNKLGPVLSEVSSSRHIKRLENDNV